MLKIVAMIIAIALAAVGFAQETATPAAAKPETGTVEKGKSAQSAKAAAELKEVGNKRCPVTNEPVGSMQKGSHIDYNGYRVGLCCDGCKKKFMATADESLKKAQADAAETTGTAVKKEEKKVQ
jgi:hypothetical protein